MVPAQARTQTLGLFSDSFPCGLWVSLPPAAAVSFRDLYVAL